LKHEAHENWEVEELPQQHRAFFRIESLLPLRYDKRGDGVADEIG
jgi:hypothetical protein